MHNTFLKIYICIGFKPSTMKTATTDKDTTVAALLHISTFSKYFFPFGNFIFPLIIWTAKKEDPFVDEHGRRALNFQISTFLYFVILVCLTIVFVFTLGFDFRTFDPFAIHNGIHPFENHGNPLVIIITIGFFGMLLLGLFVLELVCVITAAIKASEGEPYKFPLNINFITPTPVDIYPSKNEQSQNTQNETL